MKENWPWLIPIFGFGAIMFIALYALFTSVEFKNPQGAYIITSQGHTFFVDNFKQSNDCIEFLNEGQAVTACGDYQIRSNRGGEQSE